MTSRRLRVTAAVALVAAVLVACSIGDVDFADKACPCGSGYVCDTARDVCVLPSDLRDGSVDGVVGDSAADTSVDGGCTGEACACATDTDCKTRDLAHCGPTKKCVECVAPNDCRAGTYCNAANQCVLGCKEEGDCQISPAAPHCDLARHQCVACRTTTDCTGSDRCSPSGQCVQGCDADAGVGCAGGKQCCQGLCIDTTNDLLNCGACGNACSTKNATPSCVASACTWTCANGFGHCTTGNSGCETNLRSDPAHCGSCTTSCSTTVANATGLVCNASVCDYTSCAANWDECDGVRTNGCECSCGTKKQERCCPGGTCNAPLTCAIGANKCN